MSSPSWSFLRNPFEYATRTSYIRASIIGTFTDGALHSNPTLATLYTYYHPIADRYNNLYAAWRAQAGMQKGKTLSLTALLADSTRRINDWEYAVMGTYRKDTPEFRSLFPDGHGPFQNGSQQSRLAAFYALAMNLHTLGLATIETQVMTYYAALKTANDAQKGAIVQTGQKSDDLEAARIDLCNALYYVLGGLMQVFSKTPDTIASYFKLSLIQNKQQKVFTGHTEAGETTMIAQRTLAPTDTLSLLNGGVGRLVFFLADRADAPPPPAGAGITVLPGTDQTVPASMLGPVATAHYLLVYNPELVDGLWEVDI